MEIINYEVGELFSINLNSIFVRGNSINVWKGGQEELASKSIPNDDKEVFMSGG